MTGAGEALPSPRVGSKGGVLTAELWRPELWRLVGQLGLVLAAILALRIENAAFYGRVAPFAFAGAVVNHLLPSGQRLRFFALLSVLGMWLVFGVAQAAWIIGLGFLFIALCSLPVGYVLRVGLVVVAGIGLAFFRSGHLTAPWSVAIWSVIGSMLMFRTIVYLYDLKHLKVPPSWPERVAYFFCLPNVVFPLFPVLDFSTFRRTYYDRPAFEIYQEGIEWMVRGLVHLILYRLIYSMGTVSPADVRTGTDLVLYMVANFALYLRVSGQFHLIVGMLHLFGFRLPPTHRFFFLASSFSDLWRRINIYWKDFMQKIFYMPLFFRLMRRTGESVAIVVSTLFVLVATWFFHSYQWFWLLGTWLWSATDTVFWGILGVFLVANSLFEARRGRARSLTIPRPTPAGLLRHGLQTAAMFALMSVLWALWTSPTFASFTSLLTDVRFRSVDAAVTLAVLGLVCAAAALGYRRAHTSAPKGGLPAWAPAVTAAGLAMVQLREWNPIKERLPWRVQHVLANATEIQLNKRDQEQLQRGYYERIIGVNRFNNELWRVYSLRPLEWPRLDSTGAVRLTSDDRLEELVPGWSEMFHGSRLTVNSAGLRDREYTLQKPDGVLRIAVLGQSYVLGEGVGDDETFENIAEDLLNARSAETFGYRKIEVLNFGAPGYSAMQQRADLAGDRVRRWNPDVVLCVGNIRESSQVGDYLAAYLRQRGADNLPDHLRPWIERTGITAAMDRDEAERRAQPLVAEYLAKTYADMARLVRDMQATPVFAFIPTPDIRKYSLQVEQYLLTASQAGFAAMLDLRTVYDGLDQKKLIVAEWDRHPNALAHRHIGTRLHDELLQHAELLREAGRTAADSSAPPGQ